MSKGQTVEILIHIQVIYLFHVREFPWSLGAFRRSASQVRGVLKRQRDVPEFIQVQALRDDHVLAAQPFATWLLRRELFLFNNLALKRWHQVQSGVSRLSYLVC